MATDDDALGPMTPREQAVAEACDLKVQEHRERLAALHGPQPFAQVAEALQVMRSWWSTLAALTETEQLGDTGELRSHTAAFLDWWSTKMNGWFATRQDLLYVIAGAAGLEVPRPEDLDAGGDVFVYDRLVGSFSFQYVPEDDDAPPAS